MYYDSPRISNDDCTPAEAHRGTVDDFQRRHLRDVGRSLESGPDAVRKLEQKLLYRVADTRNLRRAWDYLALYGGPAAGPNEIRFEDVDECDVWDIMRAIRRSLLDGTYTVGPYVRRKNPKTSGIGYRILKLFNFEDRVVSRAIHQIVCPLVDTRFDELSFGFRPGLGRTDALATALHLAESGGRHVWVVEDIRDAFDNVERDKLLEAIKQCLPNASPLISLMANMIGGSIGRGIPQGLPLSPLLLNVLLNHFVDRPWRQMMPGTHLLRTADDLLVLCQAEKEGRRAREILTDLLDRIGMHLKPATSSQANLQAGGEVEWLGYRISRTEQGYRVRIAESAWYGLREKLREAHRYRAPVLRAQQILSGWFGQLGPCYSGKDLDQVIVRALAMAEEFGLAELSGELELHKAWREAHMRWVRLVRSLSGSLLGSGGSALHFFPAECRRTGAAAVPLSPVLHFASDRTITVYTDGACHTWSYQGGWGAVFLEPDSAAPVTLSEHLPRTTNNRAELLAVIYCLERMPVETPVEIVSDSQYVVDGLSRHLPTWKAQNWRCGSKRRRKKLQNADLWQKLDDLITGRRIHVRKVAAHSGDQWNEMADRLAESAIDSLPPPENGWEGRSR